MSVWSGDVVGWKLELKTKGTAFYNSGTLTVYCVWPLNSLGGAEPIGLGNNHLSPTAMEYLPQFISLKLHLDSIFLSQTSTAIAVSAASAVSAAPAASAASAATA